MTRQDGFPFSIFFLTKRILLNYCFVFCPYELTMRIDNNTLNGTIPTELGMMKNLTKLSLGKFRLDESKTFEAEWNGFQVLSANDPNPFGHRLLFSYL